MRIVRRSYDNPRYGLAMQITNNIDKSFPSCSKFNMVAELVVEKVLKLAR